MAPGGYLNLSSALESFSTSHCANGLTAVLDPNSPMDPDFQARFSGTPAQQQAAAADFFDRLREFAMKGENSTANVPAPPCNQQAPFQSIGDVSELSQFLHVYAQD